MHACKLIPACSHARYPPAMRSMDTDPTPAERFGAWLTAAATAAGYDTTSGSGGRAELARACGMSPSAVGRTLDGKTLPRPSQFEAIARAVHRDVREALVEGGIISAESWTDSTAVAVRSQPTAPEQVLDSWGIHDPTLRAMLLANIKQAIELSGDQEDSGSRGATAKG